MSLATSRWSLLTKTELPQTPEVKKREREKEGTKKMERDATTQKKKMKNICHSTQRNFFS